MRTRFQCPDCKTNLNCTSEKAGTQVLCPTCKIRVIVPTAAKLGIFIEEYEDPPKKNGPTQPPLVAEPLPPSPQPIEKDWRKEPPLPLALPEDIPSADDSIEDDESDDDDNEDQSEYRPTTRRRARPAPHVSLLPTTLLVIAEALFGVAALAIACVAFVRVR